MRARAKDTISRQEKGHFGRQRLDILAKGICSTKPSEISSYYSRTSALEINLAHARKKLLLDGAGITQNFIPSSIHVTPNTPHSTQQRRAEVTMAHTSSSASSRSTVLDNLDLSERKCAKNKSMYAPNSR